VDNVIDRMPSYHALADLAPSWRRSLRAANRSEKTITAYLLAADQFTAYLASHNLPSDVSDITADHVRAYLQSVLDTRAAATAKQRHGSLLQFFKWAEAEGEIEVNPMAHVRAPKVVLDPPPVLTVDEMRRLLKACEGKDFTSGRDEAIVRLFIDTGARLGEIAGLTVDTIDLDLEVAVVYGKARKFRSVPFGKSTTRALDRYLRLRHSHHHARLDALWLGKKGALRDSGIEQMIARRSEAAGLGRVNPHRFRHTFAHSWLAAGGNEGDLQRIAGWSSPVMLQRYGAGAADERARDAHRRLALGDQL
jgi:site-specific recombinase XerD